MDDSARARLSRRGFLGASAGAVAIPLALGGTATAAAADEDGFRFGVIADCQYADFPDTGTRYYRSSIGKLAEAVDTFNQADLDFITHLGDFVDRFERSFAELLPTFEKARRVKYHPPAPYYTTAARTGGSSSSTPTTSARTRTRPARRSTSWHRTCTRSWCGRARPTRRPGTAPSARTSWPGCAAC
ncbi:metallophosphoesterase family protein [Jiangella alkaliphila]|uniref:metallophosphoesterase n=1 Tax=Jiangella alkaliphila TaxID=419479 RepID=UPI00069B47B8|nr:metallophosphoesterase [Jiangella alkaliphila]